MSTTSEAIGNSSFASSSSEGRDDGSYIASFFGRTVSVVKEVASSDYAAMKKMLGIWDAFSECIQVKVSDVTDLAVIDSYSTSLFLMHVYLDSHLRSDVGAVVLKAVDDRDQIQGFCRYFSSSSCSTMDLSVLLTAPWNLKLRSYKLRQEDLTFSVERALRSSYKMVDLSDFLFPTYGAGVLLVHEVYTRAQKAGKTTVQLSSMSTAETFYKGIGMDRCISKFVFDVDPRKTPEKLRAAVDKVHARAITSVRSHVA